MTEFCEWHLDDPFCSENDYETQCGKTFVLLGDESAEKSFNFFPYCGKKLKEIAPKNDEEE